MMTRIKRRNHKLDLPETACDLCCLYVAEVKTLTPTLKKKGESGEKKNVFIKIMRTESNEQR